MITRERLEVFWNDCVSASDAGGDLSLPDLRDLLNELELEIGVD